MPEWPNKADRKTLFEAATKRKKTVTFSDDRVFKLQYDKRKSIAWGEYDVVYVSLADGNIDGPCGWFHIKFIMKDDQ